MSDGSNGARFGVWAPHHGNFGALHLKPLPVEIRPFAAQVFLRRLERERKNLETAQ